MTSCIRLIGSHAALAGLTLFSEPSLFDWPLTQAFREGQVDYLYSRWFPSNYDSGPIRNAYKAGWMTERSEVLNAVSTYELEERYGAFRSRMIKND